MCVPFLFKSENTAVGIRHADHVALSIRKQLALTSPTSCSRPVGIVHSRIKATEFSFSFSSNSLLKQRWCLITEIQYIFAGNCKYVSLFLCATTTTTTTSTALRRTSSALQTSRRRSKIRHMSQTRLHQWKNSHYSGHHGLKVYYNKCLGRVRFTFF
jgi:hypothetical protein